jgi:hypothetical protein
MRSNDCRPEARIVGQAEPHRDIVEILALDPLGERSRVSGRCPRPAPGPRARPRRQADRVIALAGADVGDRHARLDAGQAITSSASPSRSRASSVEKLSPTIGATSRCGSGKRGAAARRRRRRQQRAKQQQEQALASPYSTSSTSTFLAGHALRQGRGHEAVEVAVEHVAGAVEVTPVRRSFTS